jgi:hypothetical protein
VESGGSIWIMPREPRAASPRYRGRDLRAGVPGEDIAKSDLHCYAACTGAWRHNGSAKLAIGTILRLVR